MDSAAPFNIRLTKTTEAQVSKYVRSYPHVWPTRSQFVRSAVFWFLKEKAGALSRYERELRRTT